MRSIAKAVLDLKLELNERSGPGAEATRNRDAVLAAYRARLKGDGQPLLKLIHPQCQFTEPASLPYGGTDVGPDGVIHAIGRIFTYWQTMKVEFEDFLAGGDLVIGYFQMTGVGAATGQTYTSPGCVIFRFKDGKIAEWRTLYGDTHLIRKVCGGA